MGKTSAVDELKIKSQIASTEVTPSNPGYCEKKKRPNNTPKRNLVAGHRNTSTNQSITREGTEKLRESCKPESTVEMKKNTRRTIPGNSEKKPPTKKRDDH